MIVFAILALFEIGVTRPILTSASVAERSKAPDLTIRPPSEVPGSNPARGTISKKNYFFLLIGDKNSLSLTEALASLVIALQRGMIEKTCYFRHSMQKTGYFQHSMLRKL